MKKGPKTFQSGLHKDFSLTTANRYIRLAKTKISIKVRVSIKNSKNITCSSREIYSAE